MKHLFKKCFIAGILSLSLLTSNVIRFPSLFPSVAFAAENKQHGGRMDCTLGKHSSTIRVTAALTHETRIQMWDKNWKSVWAGSYPSGTHVLYCGSDVYTVTFYLDLDKHAYVEW